MYGRPESGNWSGEWNIEVVDCCTGETLFEDSEAHSDGVWSIAFSADGRRLATGGWDRTIRVRDTETWATIGSPVEGHSRCVTSVAFSRNGQQLASASDDGTVRLWDVTPANCVGNTSSGTSLSERAVLSVDSVECVTFDLEGERIISASGGGFVRIGMHILTRKGAGKLWAQQTGVWRCISRDGLRVASGSWDKTVRLWNAQTGAELGSPLKGHSRGVTGVSISPDGRQVVSGSLDRT